MSPDAAQVVAIVGRGPCTETRIICSFKDEYMTWDQAETRVKNAITEAVQAGRIEMFVHGCYQIATKMPKAKPDA